MNEERRLEINSGRVRGTQPERVIEGRDYMTDPQPPHGGSLREILAWTAYWERDLGEFIARHAEQYLDALEGRGDGPIDLPGGAPVDDPQPPNWV